MGSFLLLSALLALQPAPDSVYRWDLTRYFPNPETEVAARAGLRGRIESLRAAGTRLGQSPVALLRALRLGDSVRMESKRHTIYLYLRTQLNTQDQSSREAMSRMDAELEAATGVLAKGLQALKEATVATWIRAVPALGTYRFAIAQARAMRPYTLAPELEGVVARLAPVAVDWPQALYHRLIARTDFGTLTTPSGELRVMRDRGAIAALPDTALRAEGIRRLWAGYRQHRDLYAMALAGTVRARDAVARTRGFRDAPDEAYRRAHLSREAVLGLLDRVRPAARVYLDFQRASLAISREPRRPPSGGAGTPLRFGLSQAADTIRMVLAPLGQAEYARELAELLNPASGRVDVSGGLHRAGGGGASGYPGVPSTIYLESFAGSYADLSRLAHESAHAVENQLVHLHRVPAVYAQGASYLSEAYAGFTELVLANTLYERATNPRLKRYYLGQFLSSAMEVFRGAQDADLEQSIYHAVERTGESIGPDDFDSLTSRVDSSYRIAGASQDARARWITARLLYEDPLYLFNYMYSGLLALKLFESYQRDPAAFGVRYVALLSSGYRALPMDAVRQAFGIDLEDPRLLDEATVFLTARLDAYRAPLPDQ